MSSQLGPMTKLVRGRGPQLPTGARGAATPIFYPLFAQLCQITSKCPKLLDTKWLSYEPKTISPYLVVYKIPYRRARAWPSSCKALVCSQWSAFRPSARASKGILHTTYIGIRTKFYKFQFMNWLNINIFE